MKNVWAFGTKPCNIASATVPLSLLHSPGTAVLQMWNAYAADLW